MKHILLMIALLCSALAAQAEQVKIPVGQQGAGQEVQNMPTRGMTMQQVLDRFGQPQSVKGPVGEPPIETWVYPAFTVFFERQYVIHSVINRK
ncbi:hypothetical protein AAIA72_02450 [Hahella sp. SMD15-11]|uniref:Outer membrane protein assembly factor BamE n=1 Tax=Thermohahella caldifontis TaxID=3142973 RepID=A0AB39UXU9_9GAMM